LIHALKAQNLRQKNTAALNATANVISNLKSQNNNLCEASYMSSPLRYVITNSLFLPLTKSDAILRMATIILLYFYDFLGSAAQKSIVFSSPSATNVTKMCIPCISFKYSFP
jgi:hypothetical protein